MTRPYKGGRGDRNQEGGELGLQQRAAHIMKGNCIWWAQLPRPNAACNRETAYGGPYVQFPTLLVTTSFRQRAFQELYATSQRCMLQPNSIRWPLTSSSPRCPLQPASDSVRSRKCMPLPNAACYSQTAYGGPYVQFPTLHMTTRSHTLHNTVVYPYSRTYECHRPCSSCTDVRGHRGFMHLCTL
jgi:hypothetical protein